MTKISLLALLAFLGICIACQPEKPAILPTATVPPPTSTVASPSAMPTITPTAHQDSEPNLTGVVAFYSDRDGNPEIYIMNADGSGVARLTNDPAFDDSPALSPDGRRIAFLTARHDPKPKFPDLKYELYVMDIDESNLCRLTNTESAENHPAWSPDGSRIAFNGLVPRSRNTDIFLVNADGSNLLQLTDSPGFDENPAWSPDGSQIAFQTQRSGNFELYVMYPDGSGQRPLAAHLADELWPSWALSTPSLFIKAVSTWACMKLSRLDSANWTVMAISM